MTPKCSPRLLSLLVPDDAYTKSAPILQLIAYVNIHILHLQQVDVAATF
jgi:hypothetical protein